MKKLAIAIAAVVVLVVAAVLVIPPLVPLDSYRTEIENQVGEATGRTLTIGGAMRFSLVPRIEIEVADVALANPPGAAEPEMARIGKLVLALRLWPLLRGALEIDRFALIEPVIDLEADVDGRPNWVLGPAGAAEETGPAGENGAGVPALGGLRLGDVRLVNGRVRFRDAAGALTTLEGIEATLSLPALDQPLRADGKLTFNGEALTVGATLTTPKSLGDGAPTAVALKIEGTPLNLAFDGTVSLGDTVAAKGALSLKVPSARRLAAWAGKPLDLPGSGFEALSLKGTLAVTGSRYALGDLTLRLDAIEGSGDLALDLGGQWPRLTATLALARLDLTPYLPPPAKATEAPSEATAAADWSDQPIALAGLRALDAKLSLNAETIVARAFEVGPAALSLTLTKGDLVIDLSSLKLYGGSAQARLRVDASGPVPAIEHRLALSGVQAGPLLTAAGFDRLAGTAEAEIALSGAGLSERALVAGLSGEGRVRFTDGAITGINLAAMVRNVESAFLNPTADTTQKTDFAELSASFRIADGILTTEDARLAAPLLRLAGTGTVDLPGRRLEFHIAPKLAATAEGQGGAANVAGVTIPVLIEGPWDDLAFRPDLEAIAAGAIANPKALVEGAKGLAGGLKAGAGAVKGAAAGATGGVAKENAGKAVEGIIQGVTGGSAPAPLGGAIKKLFGD